MQLLQSGVTVSRTADDLVRYHGKMMIMDGRVLHVYGFNFTSLDIKKSRSFGIITQEPKLVQEAMKLFEDDFQRQPYTAANDRFVVSPENARERLAAFIKGARKQLLIYDPGLTDDAMVRLLEEREKKGVEVRIIGKVDTKERSTARSSPASGCTCARSSATAGGRSSAARVCARLELEKRREVGVIVNDEKVVREMQAIFEQDWAETESGKKETKKAEKAEKKQEAAAAS